MWNKNVFVVIAVGLLGFCGVVLRQSRNDLARLEEAQRQSTMMLGALSRGQQGAVGALVASNQAVRELSQTCRHESTPEKETAPSSGGADRKTPTEPDQALSPETTEAIQATHEVVDAALARGLWTEEDQRALHKERMSLSPTQYKVELDRLLIALNSRKLKVDSPTLLF